MGNTIFSILLIVAFVVAIILQIFLSKKKSKWPGLILPIINFIVPVIIIIVTISIVLSFPAGITIEYDENGQIINRVETNDEFYMEIMYDSDGDIVSKTTIGPREINWSEVALSFLLNSIPTAILIVIYVVCRRMQKKKSELEKMNMQDLA